MPPYFEDLAVGHVERSAPGVTLTEGMAAVHQAIVGDRLALALDAPLAREVLGTPNMLAHPALVWDVAIGQSTSRRSSAGTPASTSRRCTRATRCTASSS